MSLRGWFSGKAAVLQSSTPPPDALQEQERLQDAMNAAQHIFDDDLESAVAAFGQGDSAFHKLGRGLAGFFRATLSFESEAIKDATSELVDAETSAFHEYRHAGRERHGFQSEVYSLGAEFLLCGSEAQLMQAVMGVLNESLAESLRGFYKMRKAYMALEGLLAEEDRYRERMGNQLTKGSRNSTASRPDLDPPAPITKAADKEVDDTKGHLAPVDHDSDVDEFDDAPESLSKDASADYSGHMENGGALHDPDKSHDDRLVAQDATDNTIKTGISTDGIDEVLTHPIDIYIHSGINMCFGMLILTLSMIPPVFSRLLSIIGFRGDRERGLRLLWQASKFNHINGTMAGLVLLAYYNTFVAFCDIIPDADPDRPGETENIMGYPAERLNALLLEMRQRHPKSCIWVIEEARMHAYQRKLATGIKLLIDHGNSPFKQLAALAQFEKALQQLFSHEHEACAASFERCCELNDWSHALYLYIAGCSYLQLYRNAASDPTVAAAHASRATDLFSRAQGLAGKKRFMMRQLPFEIYIARKLAKWEARAAHLNIPLVDAVSGAPCEEMIYHFGGLKKMDATQLATSTAHLDTSEALLDHASGVDVADDRAAISVLRAAVMRARNQPAAARTVLAELLRIDPSAIRGRQRDEWPLPVAYYEMAAILWAQRSDTARNSTPEEVSKADGSTLDGAAATKEPETAAAAAAQAVPASDSSETPAMRVRSAQTHLDRAANWGSYDLEARMGMRITTGRATVRAWLQRQG